MIIRSTNARAALLCGLLYLICVVICSRIGTLAQTLVLLPLALILPGLMVVLASVDVPNYSVAEIVALGFGVNVALLIVGGAILNALPNGLTLDSWLAFTVCITVVSLVARFVRRARLASAEQRPSTGVPDWRLWLRAHVKTLSLCAASLLLVVGSLALAQYAERNQHEPFTQMWVLPASSADQQLHYSIGIRNQEEVPTHYRVRALVDGSPAATDMLVNVAVDESRQLDLPLPLSTKSGSVLEVFLFRDDGNAADISAAPYRYTKIHIDGQPR